MKKNFTKTSAIILAAVALSGTASHADWKTDPDAIQLVYMNGVPHTDKNGRPMLKYDAARSFLPISIYHALETENGGVTYKLSDLKKAGFNSAFAWMGVKPIPMAKSAVEAGLQMIFWNPEPDEVKELVNNPAVLGYCMDDEPIGHLGGDLEDRFAKILARRDAIRKVDKTHPVFLVDAPWVTPPAREWWVKLNTWGDISSHDNYPINSRNLSLSNRQGLPETVALAAAVNKEEKPVWFVAQSFEWQDPTFQATFPTAVQQRCMVYAAFIHGATGIVHFSLDSFVTREVRVVGIAPDPKPKYSIGMTATNSQLRQARDMWNATVDLNAELSQLRPVLLSPTANIPYEISLDPKWEPVTKNPVRTLLKVNPAGGYTLILANIDAAPQRIRVHFPDKKDYTLTELFNPPGASMFERKDDAFEFQAAPYDVRVFQVDLK